MWQEVALVKREKVYTMCSAQSVYYVPVLTDGHAGVIRGLESPPGRLAAGSTRDLRPRNPAKHGKRKRHQSPNQRKRAAHGDPDQAERQQNQPYDRINQQRRDGYRPANDEEDAPE